MVSGRVAAEVGSSYVSEGKGERKNGKTINFWLQERDMLNASKEQGLHTWAQKGPKGTPLASQEW